MDLPRSVWLRGHLPRIHSLCEILADLSNKGFKYLQEIMVLKKLYFAPIVWQNEKC